MRRSIRSYASIVSILGLLFLPLSVLAQTKIDPPKNPYRVEEDVKLGRQAASEVERQMPLLRDEVVGAYLERLGRRLEESIPREYQHPEFRFSFKVVDVSDLNAFALPGGFTYVNRGMISASKNEGELAGVMSHEISHVALRHGTAQVAKAQKPAIGATIGQILGAVLGGPAGGAVAAGTQVLAGAYVLKYSRSYERQADTLGAQIMARAGYDPRDLANVFQTLERESGGRSGPEWLSSHPNPGKRYEEINREAQLLRVSNPVRDTQEFERVKARLSGMPRARSMEEASRSGGRPSSGGSRTSTRRGEPPSTSLATYQSSDGYFSLGYPSNWRAYSQSGFSVTLAPEWALEGSEITHGVIVNYDTREQYRGSLNLTRALDLVIQELKQGNQGLSEQRNARYTGRLDGERAVATYLTGRNNLGYTERAWLIVRPTSDGIVYMILFSPEQDFDKYQSAFTEMIRSFNFRNR